MRSWPRLVRRIELNRSRRACISLSPPLHASKLVGEADMALMGWLWRSVCRYHYLWQLFSQMSSCLHRLEYVHASAYYCVCHRTSSKRYGGGESNEPGKNKKIPCTCVDQLTEAKQTIVPIACIPLRGAGGRGGQGRRHPCMFCCVFPFLNRCRLTLRFSHFVFCLLTCVACL